MDIKFFIYFLTLQNFIFAQNKGLCISGDCANGFGYYRWETGDYYLGNFKNFLPDGLGVLYYRIGKKYIGHFEKNSFNGAGTLFYQNGESRKGIWKNNELQNLIRNPNYNLKDYLPKAELVYEQILKDRPQMQAYAPQKNEDIYQFLIKKIAGEDVLNLIYWQNAEDENFPVPKGVTAAHRFPSPTQTAAIWIQDGIESENMWAGLCFELFNIQNYSNFQLINEDVVKNKCQKADFVMRYAKLEHSAILKLQQFYKKNWLTYCKKNGLKSNKLFWYADVSPNFEQWINLYTDKKSYPYYPYEDYFDNLIKFNLNRF
jgi:hypothetical protein